MKKLLLVLFSITFAAAACAESEADRLLKDAGLLDNDYVYVDTELITKLSKELTESYVKTLPVDLNYYMQITDFSVTPYYFKTTYRLVNPLNVADTATIKRELNSVETLRRGCALEFLVNEYMKANNMTLIYAYRDANDQPLAEVTMTNEICDKAKVQ